MRICAKYNRMFRVGFGSRIGIAPQIARSRLYKPVNLISRLYASIPPIKSKKREPRIRYLFYMFVLSSLTIYFGTKYVDRKKVRTSFGSEKELSEYEQVTGIKRRSRLIAGENSQKYKFYSVPYVEDEKFITELSKSLGPTKVKIIDPEQLVKAEREDETQRYSFLLQDLKKNNQPLPHGLITALIKQEVSLYINTSQGIYDTNFVLKNYPRDTSEASKFETDIAYLEKVVMLKSEATKMAEKLEDRDVRNINNVLSYFETVGKSELYETPEDLNK